ncbi:uncharacterized protein BX664DRAFT_194522 [Halteromyces radiatus]|uniref:uncharacterized protein n=1 Tax=Halteromyces radiatus TaxID=101107 RepID=UPI00221ECAF3|nr:uncharacterized protein BX664DRAFT_194522 [Halteromyces radiatus]KAI8081467.1 hypothetical protein BX664DRAFT_194522 [Halteromyces radiatus]
MIQSKTVYLFLFFFVLVPSRGDRISIKSQSSFKYQSTCFSFFIFPLAQVFISGTSLSIEDWFI